MEYKTEFDRDKPKFGELKLGELHRSAKDHFPRIRSGKPNCFACVGSGNSGWCDDDEPVVRIRIDRVEAGVPVFVDA